MTPDIFEEIEQRAYCDGYAAGRGSRRSDSGVAVIVGILLGMLLHAVIF